MLKKVLLVGLSMFTINSYAQFMGIDDIPVKKEDEIKLFNNAIKSKDLAFIKQWENEKGLKFAYDDKNICFINDFNKRNETVSATKFPMKNLPVYLDSSGTRAYFSSCETLPLFDLIQYSNVYKTPTFFKYTGSYKNYMSSASPDMKAEYQLVTYLTDKVIDNLEPNQWDQLIQVVVSDKVDFEIRKKALSIILKNKDNMNALQKQYKETIEKYYKTNRVMNESKFLAITDPINYMFTELYKNFLHNSGIISQNDIQLTIPKKFWFDQNIELNFSEIKNIRDQESLIVISNAYLLREIMQTKEYNIDFQFKSGETMLHKAASTPHNFNKNRVFANFLRAQLEKGLNYKLLNAKKETFYEIFEKNKDTSSYAQKYYEYFNEAIRAKEYNY